MSGGAGSSRHLKRWGGALVVMTLLVGASGASKGEAVHWNQFRGPNGSGVVDAFRPPVEIDAQRRAWKISIPDGQSSPVLWGDRIFVTGVENDRLVAVCLNAKSGDILWKRRAPKTPLEKVHKTSSPAASSPCADAERVFAYFGSYGLLCYDHAGELVWEKPLPTPKSLYGMATSPIVHGDRVILALDDDANLRGSKLSRSRLIALNKQTGEVVWETARPYNRSGWSTPVIWNHGGGVEVVVLGSGRAYGYDVATGGEQWFVGGFSRETIATPVIGDGKVHLSASRRGGWGDDKIDPEPFWKAALSFDRNGDGRVGRDEISKDFTLPFRPELPPGHPGFGMPLPDDPKRRKERQLGLFGWRDTNKDGFWTREEFVKDMVVGRGQPSLAAVRPGGQGDVTESHVAWNLRSGIPEIPSPVFHDGRLYLVRAGGVLSCVDAEDGAVIYRERIGAAGQYSASPVMANDRLYLVSARGQITVVKTGDVFEIEQQTELGSPVAATPAMDAKTFYVRTDEGLMAFR